jgi:hypothetical protein
MRLPWDRSAARFDKAAEQEVCIAVDNLLDHAVCEIFLLRIATHFLERQNRDRRLIGQLQRRYCAGIRGQCCGPSSDLHIEYPEWPRDILDLLFAPVVESKIELVSYLVSHHPADADPGGAKASSWAATLTPSPSP